MNPLFLTDGYKTKCNMEAIILISIGILCITFIAVAFHHVSTHEKIDATGLKRLFN